MYLAARLRYAALGYAVTDHLLAIRHGIVGRQTYLVPIEKVQAVGEVRQIL